LFAGWPTSGNDATSGEVIFALAVALDTRGVEGRELEVHGRRFPAPCFSLAETFPERPKMVRPKERIEQLTLDIIEHLC